MRMRERERGTGGRTDIHRKRKTYRWIYCKRWETVTDDRNEIARELTEGNVPMSSIPTSDQEE